MAAVVAVVKKPVSPPRQRFASFSSSPYTPISSLRPGKEERGGFHLAMSLFHYLRNFLPFFSNSHAHTFRAKEEKSSIPPSPPYRATHRDSPQMFALPGNGWEKKRRKKNKFALKILFRFPRRSSTICLLRPCRESNPRVCGAWKGVSAAC